MNPYVAKAPFIITSTDMKVIESGLKRLQGRGLAGPVSLKDGDEVFLEKVRNIRQYGAAVVVPLIDEQGLADSKQRQIEIGNRINQLLEVNNIPVDSIVYDL